jgi:hypothetical protein
MSASRKEKAKALVDLMSVIIRLGIVSKFPTYSFGMAFLDKWCGKEEDERL